MKLLIEPSNKNNIYKDIVNGLIVSLKDYSVQSPIYYSLDEIKQLRTNNPQLEIYVNINKNLLNDDIEPLKEILKELDNLNLHGIFFYDLALLKLKKELNLNIDLVWNQTHMVNN